MIHSLEDVGFKFIEFRLTKTLDLQTLNAIGKNVFYPFMLHSITDEKIYTTAKKLLFSDFHDDRFSKDPFIKKNISKARLAEYLRKSFTHQPKEFLYGLINVNSHELVAFKSGELMHKDEAAFYLTGSIKNQENKYRNMLESLLISELKEKGVKWIKSITSGLNVIELNLTTRDLPYRIESSSVILRKIYI